MSNRNDEIVGETKLWDAEAETFDQAADHGLKDPTVRAAWRALPLQHLPTPPARILDLGCGTGTLTALLAQEGNQVDGLDFSPKMIRLANIKAAGLIGVTMRIGDAYDPPCRTRRLRRHPVPAPALGHARPCHRTQELDAAAGCQRRPAPD